MSLSNVIAMGGNAQAGYARFLQPPQADLSQWPFHGNSQAGAQLPGFMGGSNMVFPFPAQVQQPSLFDSILALNVDPFMPGAVPPPPPLTAGQSMKAFTMGAINSVNTLGAGSISNTMTSGNFFA